MKCQVSDLAGQSRHSVVDIGLTGDEEGEDIELEIEVYLSIAAYPSPLFITVAMGLVVPQSLDPGFMACMKYWRVIWYDLVRSESVMVR